MHVNRIHQSQDHRDVVDNVIDYNEFVNKLVALVATGRKRPTATHNYTQPRNVNDTLG